MFIRTYSLFCVFFLNFFLRKSTQWHRTLLWVLYRLLAATHTSCSHWCCTYDFDIFWRFYFFLFFLFLFFFLFFQFVVVVLSLVIASCLTDFFVFLSALSLILISVFWPYKMASASVPLKKKKCVGMRKQTQQKDFPVLTGSVHFMCHIFNENNILSALGVFIPFYLLICFFFCLQLQSNITFDRFAKYVYIFIDR